MQFRLGTLLGLVTLVAVFCGVVFAAPLSVTAIVLCLTMWLSPAVWISGASYAQGGKQAFFRGGLICGILPFVAISSFGTLMLLQGWSAQYGQEVLVLPGASATGDGPEVLVLPGRAQGGWDGQLATGGGQEELNARLRLAGLWLTPGLFAFLGGAMGYVTWRLITPKQEPTSADAQALDYRVVSGRLTTQNADAS